MGCGATVISSSYPLYYLEWAHAMSPHQASGAAQAIEDSYILSSQLTHPLCTKTTIPRALTIYDSIRRPVVNIVLEGSGNTGHLFDV